MPPSLRVAALIAVLSLPGAALAQAGPAEEIVVTGDGSLVTFFVENVTDEYYWASVGGFPGSNYLVLGAPLTLLVSASVDL